MANWKLLQKFETMCPSLSAWFLVTFTFKNVLHKEMAGHVFLELGIPELLSGNSFLFVFHILFNGTVMQLPQEYPKNNAIFLIAYSIAEELYFFLKVSYIVSPSLITELI